MRDGAAAAPEIGRSLVDVGKIELRFGAYHLLSTSAVTEGDIKGPAGQGPLRFLKIWRGLFYLSMKKETLESKVDAKNGRIPSMDQKAQYAVFTNSALERSEIKEWLVSDMKRALVTVSEVLQSNDALEALTEVYWKRYCKYHESAQAQPELPLKDKEVSDV